MAATPAAEAEQRGPGSPAHGAAQIERAADGDALSPADERSALDFLLGTPEAARYKVTVAYETPAGMKDLIFRFKAMDGRKLDKIEQSHLDERTGMMDKISADAHLVSEAVYEIVDPETDKSVEPKSEAFRTMKEGEAPLASPIDAITARFGTQIGLIAGVASAIREAAGWDRDRVGKASRLLVDAAGN